VPIYRDDPARNDFESKIDYDVLTGAATIKAGEYGTATISYDYYRGKYRNNSATTSYEFSDNIVRVTVKPSSYRGVQVSGTGYYYRGHRDQDIEKSKIGVAATYPIEGYTVGVEYDVFNFDDYVTLDKYYTANIVRIFVRKNIAF
jgi:hypothetical protein